LAGSVPVNGNFYYHLARTGGNMVQVQGYRSNDTASSGWLNNQRGHAQGHLRYALVTGRQYCVSFYISMEQLTRYAFNNWGAYLDDGTIDTVQWPRQGSLSSVPVTPQVFDTTLFADTLTWHRVQGSFTANGTERLITIANFFDSAHTRAYTVSIPTPFYPAGGGDMTWGFYLIDDVSVIDIDAVAEAGKDTALSGETPDSVWVGNHDGYVPCRWYTTGGALIDSNVGGFPVKPTSTTSYIMELDVCGHITRDTVTVRVMATEVRDLGYTTIKLLCYPNPATGEVTLEGAKDCRITFSDVLGRTVLSVFLKSGRETVDVSSLPKGLYILKLTTPGGIESVAEKVSVGF
ncbi:MAG: T9SS type A sorting domain-containing protein, partial [Taibaiella sp.]|nr:T9SS type A sorting domain-containing protein [Taibaiella sp.]